MKKVAAVAAIVFLLTGILGMTLALDLLNYARRPLPGEPLEKIVFIKSGEGFGPVLQVLQKNGFRISPFRFRMIALVLGWDKQIKAGEYLLSTNTTPAHLLGVLVSGRERLHRLTIPEGYTMAQMADLLNKSGLPVGKPFLDLCRDPAWIASLGIGSETLEGYLYPDTYYFPGTVTAEKVIRVMTDRFKAVFSPEQVQQAASLGLSAHQAVILASMIEKETGDPAERPLISSVFHNRMRKHMRLESDPTVIYGIKDFDGNLTRKHLKTVTPYNTYQIQGLPQGPIANPGGDSLRAALHPAKTDYLYFVSKNNGTHYFSTRLEEHERAVEKYQKGK